MSIKSRQKRRPIRIEDREVQRLTYDSRTGEHVRQCGRKWVNV